MKNSGAVSRPVRIEDAEDLQRNILSRNTVEEVKDRIDFYLGCYNKGIGIQIIAEIDGEAIASLELKKKNHPLYKHRAELFSLVVNPKHQRKGIARMLVKNAAEYAKEIGVEILEVGCRGGTPAETVYQKLGFAEYARLPRGIIDATTNGNAFDEVRFYKLA